MRAKLGLSESVDEGELEPFVRETLQTLGTHSIDFTLFFAIFTRGVSMGLYTKSNTT